jgi:hypothetical protein
MATKVSKEEDIELQDGTVVEIKPLNIKSLRKFMEVVKVLEDEEADDNQTFDAMVEACAIPIGRANKELGEDRDALEEVLDVPTMWKILEVAGGIKVGDGAPNLATAPPGTT